MKALPGDFSLAGRMNGLSEFGIRQNWIIAIAVLSGPMFRLRSSTSECLILMQVQLIQSMYVDGETSDWDSRMIKPVKAAIPLQVPQ